MGVTVMGLTMGLTEWLIVAGVVGVVAVLVWLARRKGWILAGRRYARGRFLPASPPAAGGTARVIDAIVLGAAATILIAIVATRASSGGLMLALDTLPSKLATLNILLFAAVIVGGAVAVAIALLGRSGVGTIALAVVLSGYGLVLNTGCAGPNPDAVTVTDYTIEPRDIDIPGAELWVNGVHLGTLPYTASMEDFTAKVPEWTSPPEDYETSTIERTQHWYNNTATQTHKKWIRIEPPAAVNVGRDGDAKLAYYAQVRYAGEWAAVVGDSYTSGGNRWQQSAHSHFDLILPQRAQRLDTLLNQARLADYQVGDAWLDALDTYGHDGWIALQEAVVKEPAMRQVLIAWATRRHDLAAVTDADSAWRVFQRLCDKADKTAWYSTDSIDGLALSLLIPKLSPERLVGLAEETIATLPVQYFDFRYGHGWGNNHYHIFMMFGNYRHSPSTSCRWLFFTPAPSNEEGSVPPRATVLAHAVWLLHEHLESSGGPNLVQERVVPALIRWRADDGYYLAFDGVLSRLGGPAAYTWFMRRYGRTSGDPLPRQRSNWNDHTVLGRNNIPVNRWFLSLACFSGPLGREFRSQFDDDLIKFAEGLLAKSSDELDKGFLSYSLNGIDTFLFTDLDKGKDCLAARVWPSFKGHVLAKASKPLEAMWEYLIRMEPVSTTEQYVEAWRSVPKDQWNQQCAPAAMLTILPPDKRRAVLGAIRAEVERDAYFANSGPGEAQREVIFARLSCVLPDEDAARWIFDKLTGQDATAESREQARLWLEQTDRWHPLVELLAAADDPDLRLMAMGALREYPTPARRQLLEQLADDPNPAVRDAAREVQAHLKILAAESPARYASNATTPPGQSR